MNGKMYIVSTLIDKDGNYDFKKSVLFPQKELALDFIKSDMVERVRKGEIEESEIPNSDDLEHWMNHNGTWVVSLDKELVDRIAYHLDEITVITTVTQYDRS